MPLQAAALQALGWSLRTVAELAQPADGPALGLLWCPDRTALAQQLHSERAFGLPVVLLAPPPDAPERRALQARGALAWLPAEAEAGLLADTLLWAQDLAAQLQARDSAAQARLDANGDGARHGPADAAPRHRRGRRLRAAA
jgi:hypothetical protein